jgi:hypothetical protein
MISGLPVGLLPGDSSWVVRTELGHVNQFPIEGGGLTITQYIFGATGERIFYQPTVLELASVHATNYGVGLRFVTTRWAELMPNSYAFVEWGQLRSRIRRSTVGVSLVECSSNTEWLLSLRIPTHGANASSKLSF